MNLLLFTAADRLGEQRIRVSDHRLQHLRQVLGAGVGEQFRVGELGGLTGAGKILEICPEYALLEIDLDRPPPPKLPLVLALALPRPKMLRRILRTVAEMGVGELHLVHSFRVEKSYWQTPLLAQDALRGYLLQGLEQSRDTVLPIVAIHRRFKPFVEDVLPGMVEGRRALLAHPGDYPPCPRDLEQETLLVIGPEGGFIPYEVAQLAKAGCQAVSLGERILRVETALSTALGRLS